MIDGRADPLMGANAALVVVSATFMVANAALVAGRAACAFANAQVFKELLFRTLEALGLQRKSPRDGGLFAHYSD